MRRHARRRPDLLIATPPAAAGQRIGLMGGSFNPPHDGHLAVSRTALRRLKLDRVWWLVSPGNPLKANDALPPLADRLAACRALTRGEPRILVSGLEADLGSAYTVDTVGFLVERFPATRFVWVMGADNLAGFHRWRRWREIAQRADPFRGRAFLVIAAVPPCHRKLLPRGGGFRQGAGQGQAAAVCAAG